MKPSIFGKLLWGLLCVLTASAMSCSSLKSTRTYKDPPPPGFQATTIDYVDSDGFDTLLESALVNQDPAIVIRTSFAKPEWGGRLNGWVAAWNMGGKVDQNNEKRRVRMQAPLPNVTVDGDSIREFRILVDGFMNRVEDIAKGTSAWWAEDKIRHRRIALLKTYNLRFHQDENRLIHLILFNGMYSKHYPEFMQAVSTCNPEDKDCWHRGVCVSHCKGQRQRGNEPD